MTNIPDPENSNIVGRESYFNEKATFFGGIEVFGGAIEGETGKKLGTGTGAGGGDIQGAQGVQGVQGPLSDFQGTQGALSDFQGTQGAQGTQGNQGVGSQGTQGTQGPLSNFQGTQGNQSAQGTQGVQGPQGVQNAQGTQGLQGVQGPQGVQNAQGTQGVQGPQGTQGVQGPQGVQNAQGTQGVQGRQGLQGTQGVGSQGSQGNQGTQGPLSNFQGTQGVQGSQGVQNAQGSQGSQGVQGVQGPQGVQNSQGTQGVQGAQGKRGIQGNQGIQSAQGAQGRAHQGTQGTQGLQGEQGPQGLQGLQGENVQGSQGLQGLQGESVQGSQGLQGESVQGSQGLQGESVQGSQGLQGEQGPQGTQGLQGTQGTKGEGADIQIADDNLLDEIVYVGYSTVTETTDGISSIKVSSEKLVFLPSSGSLGVGTSAIATVDGDNVSLTVSGIATADSYRGDGVNLVGIVTQIASGIGIDLDPTNGRGKVTITSYKPIGKTIYVAQNGNDSNTGLSENHPKRTIKNAAGIASTGDTVKVFPGVYVENNPIIIKEKVAVEGTELRNCIVTPQNSGSDLFYVNNGCHVTDLSFVGSESTGGAAIVAFQPLAGVSSDRFFDGARMIRMNLDFIGYEAAANENLSAANEIKLAELIKRSYRAICHDITRGGNSKCVGIGSEFYDNNSDVTTIGKTDVTSALDYSVGIAFSCINNISWNGNHQSEFYQIKDKSIQVDGSYSNFDIGGCANVKSAVDTCAGIVTSIMKDGYDNAGISETQPSNTDGQASNAYSDTKIGGNTFSPGVGVISQGPYIRNCTNFIGKSIGMKVDGFHAEPGDGIDNGITGSMSVDSYTQYNQNGIGVSISNGAYAQLVSIFTICNDIGHWTTGGGQCDITNSNCSFGNKGLVSDGVGDQTTRSIYRYTGEIVNDVDADGDNPDIIVVSGVGTIRPYDGQAIYIDTLYYEVSSITITNGGSGYDENNPPTIVLGDPTGPNGITAELSANVDTTGKVTSIDVINTGSQYLTTPSSTITQNGGSNLAFTVNLNPIYYGVESATLPSSNRSTITLQQNLNNTVSAGSTVYFTRSSLQLASTISLEWVGSGTDINSARPGLGGVAILDNEFVRQNGGRIIFTGTNQAGDFKIGPDLTINQLTGTISGRAFNQSLLNTVTPIIIALG